MNKRVCQRCGADENRVHGFCSVECENLYEVEQERDEWKSRASAWKALAVEAIEYIREYDAENSAETCGFCDAVIGFEDHTPDCIVTRIRKLAEESGE